MFLGYESANGGARNTGSLSRNNTVFGWRAGKEMRNSSTSLANSYFGMYAGWAGTTCGYNTSIGFYAGGSNLTGIGNTSVGNAAGYLNQGSHNTSLGNQAGPTATNTGSYYLYIDTGYRRGSDSLIYGRGLGDATSTSSLRFVTINGNFEVNANCSAVSAGWTVSSDISLKKDIARIDENINVKLNMLRPVNYTLKLNEKKDVGFIAQEIQTVFPLLVSQNKNGLLSVDYSKLTPYIVKGIQETNKTISELEKKLDEEKDKRELMEQYFKDEIDKLRKEILRN
jgi:hypothetical protein